ncbi:MAG: hypothetical protein AAF418_04340, partial [Pseudomonadota bacterium]
MAIDRFEDLIAPVSVAEFFDRLYDQKWVHIPASEEKRRALESVMNWHELESLCNMTHIWDHHLMALVLDGKQIARVDYCDHIPMR